jgi:hypothetical protein
MLSWLTPQRSLRKSRSSFINPSAIEAHQVQELAIPAFHFSKIEAF